MKLPEPKDKKEAEINEIIEAGKGKKRINE